MSGKNEFDILQQDYALSSIKEEDNFLFEILNLEEDVFNSANLQNIDATKPNIQPYVRTNIGENNIFAPMAHNIQGMKPEFQDNYYPRPQAQEYYNYTPPEPIYPQYEENCSKKSINDPLPLDPFYLNEPRATGKNRPLTGTEKKSRRKELNARSARKSRQKKKEYMGYLEGKVNSLAREMEIYKQELERVSKEEELGKLSRINAIQQLYQGRQLLYKQLELCMKEGSRDNIHAIVQQILLRTGVQAQMRRDCVELFVTKTLDSVMPISYKYLLWAARSKSGIFDPDTYIPGKNKEKTLDHTLAETVNFTPEEQKHTLLNVQPLFSNYAATIKLKMENLVQAKTELLSELEIFENDLNREVMEKVDCVKIGAYLLWTDKNGKYHPNMNLQDVFQFENGFLLNNDDSIHFESKICENCPGYDEITNLQNEIKNIFSHPNDEDSDYEKYIPTKKRLPTKRKKKSDKLVQKK